MLIEVTGVQAMIRWSGGRYVEAEMGERWLTSPTVRRFESGAIGPEEFAEGVIRDLGLSTSTEEFLTAFSHWPRGFYPDAREFLLSLRRDHGIGCLTNSNAVHWKRCVTEWGLPSLFDHCFASHLLGCVKPDGRIFEIVLSRIPRDRSEIVYFDDNAPNVRAAGECGIEAHLVKGFPELRRAVELTRAKG